MTLHRFLEDSISACCDRTFNVNRSMGKKKLVERGGFNPWVGKIPWIWKW